MMAWEATTTVILCCWCWGAGFRTRPVMLLVEMWLTMDDLNSTFFMITFPAKMVNWSQTRYATPLGQKSFINVTYISILIIWMSLHYIIYNWKQGHFIAFTKTGGELLLWLAQHFLDGLWILKELIGHCYTGWAAADAINHARAIGLWHEQLDRSWGLESETDTQRLQLN